MLGIPPSRAIHIVAAFGCLAWVCSRPKSATADSSRTSSLSWVELPGAEGCGGAPAIARAVEERLGRHVLVSPAQADLSIEARAERSGHPPLWHAVVLLRDQDGAVLGSRELGSATDDCSELRASVALAAALMIDPDAALRPRDPPAPPLPPSPPAPLAPPPPAPPTIIIQRVEVAVPAVAALPWRAEPSASLALGFGVLPSPAVGLRMGVAVAPPRVWVFEAFGGVWADQTALAEQRAQVRFSLPYVGLTVCPLRLGGDGRPTLSICSGAELGFLGGASQGFTATRSSLDPTLHLVAPARLSFPVVGGVALRAGGELGVALVRNRFVYEDAMRTTQVISDMPLVTAECDLGLSISLP
jgi:hypothetical protein